MFIIILRKLDRDVVDESRFRWVKASKRVDKLAHRLPTERLVNHEEVVVQRSEPPPSSLLHPWIADEPVDRRLFHARRVIKCPISFACLGKDARHLFCRRRPRPAVRDRRGGPARRLDELGRGCYTFGMDDRRLLERISINPQICGGRPCLRGHRITVEQILDLLASGVSPQELCGKDYFPTLTLDDIHACITFANQLVRSEDIHFFEELAAS
jgi:uncharacterized protein (DUF433 family)